MIAAVAILGMAVVVLSRAGVIEWLSRARHLTGASWGVVGMMAINTVANLTSSSHLEQFLFSRMTFVLAVLTAVVTYRTTRSD